LSAVTAGYVMVGVAWAVILATITVKLVQFWRTTTLADLVPRITRVRRTAITVVSAKRASHDPDHYEQVTPWSWRRRA